MEPEDSALEKESDSQSSTFPGGVLQHDPDQVNIGEHQFFLKPLIVTKL